MKIRQSRYRFEYILFVSILLLLTPLAPSAYAQDGPRCFQVPGITNCIEGRFLEYWLQNGGLPVFGYPITAAVPQQTAEGSFVTQYFERNRFELHPEKARPYDVLLGRLGDDALQQQGQDWSTFPKAQANAAHYFFETGHAVGHDPFWGYWSTHGLEFDGQAGTSFAESLALFGLPLSEPRMETNSSGDTVLTQWFERTRFEDHDAQGVLLGLLGNETHGAPVDPPAPTPPAPQGLQIVAKGFGQDGRWIGYGFVLQNNQSNAIGDIEYQVAAYDAGGKVIDTDHSFVEIMYPGEQLGVGGDMVLPEGKEATRIEVQARSSQAPNPDYAELGSNPLSASNVNYEPSEYFPTVTAEIINRLGQPITTVKVSAIIYDASGAIIGGGYGYLDFIPANDASAIKIAVHSNGQPARIDVYPMLTILSEIGG